MCVGTRVRALNSVKIVSGALTIEPTFLARFLSGCRDDIDGMLRDDSSLCVCARARARFMSDSAPRWLKGVGCSHLELAFGVHSD